MNLEKVNKKYFVFLSLALLVLISGCSSGGGGSSSGGILSIEAFEPDISGVDILPGEKVSFTLIVRNTGSEKAADIEPKITGLKDSGWTTGPVTTGCDKFTLNPPNPEFNTPGESKQCIFSYTAPIDLVLDQTFQPKVSISYKYDSKTVTRIHLLPREKFVIKKDSGQSIDSETVFKSRGPIDIDLSTKGQASQIRLLEGNIVTFPLFVTISNLDSGYACLDQGCKNIKKVNVKISVGGSEITLSDCNEKEVDLFKGQKGEFACQATAKAATGLEEKLVSITAQTEPYYYNIERSGSQLSVKRK